MDLKSNHTSPVLTDPAPMSNPILGGHSRLLPFSPLFLTIPRKKTGILDDVRTSGWLDAMKSSSPPPKKITKDVSNEYASSDADVAYNAWMVFLLPVVIYLFFSFGSFLSRISG